MKYLILLGLLLSFIGCRKSNKIEIKTDNNLSTRDMVSPSPSKSYYSLRISELENLIMEEGDSLAYDALSTKYLSSPELLPYSLHMADKYNNSFACFMVYTYLIIKEYPKKKDKASLDQAISYLIKSMRLGHWQARHELGNLYINGEFVEKNEELGNYILNGGNDIEGFVEKQRIYTCR